MSAKSTANTRKETPRFRSWYMRIRADSFRVWTGAVVVWRIGKLKHKPFQLDYSPSIGAPQWGHVLSSAEMSRPQSEHTNSGSASLGTLRAFTAAADVSSVERCGTTVFRSCKSVYRPVRAITSPIPFNNPSHTLYRSHALGDLCG